MNFSRLLNCLLLALKLYSQPIILGYIFWYKGIAIKVYLIWKELDYNWCLCERRVRIIWYCRKVTMYFWHTKRMYQQLGRAHWLCSFDDNWYSAFLLLINRSRPGFSKSIEEFCYPTTSISWLLLFTRSVQIWE